MLQFKLKQCADGYALTKPLREEVFMSEQGFSYDEDEHDAAAWHIAGYDGDVLIAAARLYEIAGGIFSIGRVAVKKDYRRQYIGDTLLRALEDKAVQLKGYMIEISAQIPAVPFYEKEGYEKSGGEYDEDGALHIKMIKDLTKPFKRCSCCNTKSE